MTSVASPASALERVRFAATALQVETPSWGYGNSGTRFEVFPQPGVPRTPFEKVEDAATVGKFTGVAKSIALHIPWDRVDDFSALTAFARERGVAIGASDVVMHIGSHGGAGQETGMARLVEGLREVLTDLPPGPRLLLHIRRRRGALDGDAERAGHCQATPVSDRNASAIVHQYQIGAN